MLSNRSLTAVQIDSYKKDIFDKLQAVFKDVSLLNELKCAIVNFSKVISTIEDKKNLDQLMETVNSVLTKATKELFDEDISAKDLCQFLAVMRILDVLYETSKDESFKAKMSKVEPGLSKLRLIFEDANPLLSKLQEQIRDFATQFVVSEHDEFDVKVKALLPTLFEQITALEIEPQITDNRVVMSDDELLAAAHEPQKDPSLTMVAFDGTTTPATSVTSSASETIGGMEKKPDNNSHSEFESTYNTQPNAVTATNTCDLGEEVPVVDENEVKSEIPATIVCNSEENEVGANKKGTGATDEKFPDDDEAEKGMGQENQQQKNVSRAEDISPAEDTKRDLERETKSLASEESETETAAVTLWHPKVSALSVRKLVSRLAVFGSEKTVLQDQEWLALQVVNQLELVICNLQSAYSERRDVSFQSLKKGLNDVICRLQNLSYHNQQLDAKDFKNVALQNDLSNRLQQELSCEWEKVRKVCLVLVDKGITESFEQIALKRKLLEHKGENSIEEWRELLNFLRMHVLPSTHKGVSSELKQTLQAFVKKYEGDIKKCLVSQEILRKITELCQKGKDCVALADFESEILPAVQSLRKYLKNYNQENLAVDASTRNLVEAAQQKLDELDGIHSADKSRNQENPAVGASTRNLVEAVQEKFEELEYIHLVYKGALHLNEAEECIKRNVLEISSFQRDVAHVLADSYSVDDLLLLHDKVRKLKDAIAKQLKKFDVVYYKKSDEKTKTSDKLTEIELERDVFLKLVELDNGISYLIQKEIDKVKRWDAWSTELTALLGKVKSKKSIIDGENAVEVDGNAAKSLTSGIEGVRSNAQKASWVFLSTQVVKLNKKLEDLQKNLETLVTKTNFSGNDSDAQELTEENAFARQQIACDLRSAVTMFSSVFDLNIVRNLEDLEGCESLGDWTNLECSLLKLRQDAESRQNAEGKREGDTSREFDYLDKAITNVQAAKKVIEQKEAEQKEAERKEVERKEVEQKEVERKEVEQKEVEHKEAAQEVKASLQQLLNAFPKGLTDTQGIRDLKQILDESNSFEDGLGNLDEVKTFLQDKSQEIKEEEKTLANQKTFLRCALMEAVCNLINIEQYELSEKKFTIGTAEEESGLQSLLLEDGKTVRIDVEELCSEVNTLFENERTRLQEAQSSHTPKAVGEEVSVFPKSDDEVVQNLLMQLVEMVVEFKECLSKELSIFGGKIGEVNECNRRVQEHKDKVLAGFEMCLQNIQEKHVSMSGINEIMKKIEELQKVVAEQKYFTMATTLERAKEKVESTLSRLQEIQQRQFGTSQTECRGTERLVGLETLVRTQVMPALEKPLDSGEMAVRSQSSNGDSLVQMYINKLSKSMMEIRENVKDLENNCKTIVAESNEQKEDIVHCQKYLKDLKDLKDLKAPEDLLARNVEIIRVVREKTLAIIQRTQFEQALKKWHAYSVCQDLSYRYQYNIEKFQTVLVANAESLKQRLEVIALQQKEQVVGGKCVLSEVERSSATKDVTWKVRDKEWQKYIPAYSTQISPLIDCLIEIEEKALEDNSDKKESSKEKEDLSQLIERLEECTDSLKNALKEAKEAEKEALSKFVNSIDRYLQGLKEGAPTALGVAQHLRPHPLQAALRNLWLEKENYRIKSLESLVLEICEVCFYDYCQEVLSLKDNDSDHADAFIRLIEANIEKVKKALFLLGNLEVIAENINNDKSDLPQILHDVIALAKDLERDLFEKKMLLEWLKKSQEEEELAIDSSEESEGAEESMSAAFGKKHLSINKFWCEILKLQEGFNAQVGLGVLAIDGTGVQKVTLETTEDLSKVVFKTREGVNIVFEKDLRFLLNAVNARLQVFENGVADTQAVDNQEIDGQAEELRVLLDKARKTTQDFQTKCLKLMGTELADIEFPKQDIVEWIAVLNVTMKSTTDVTVETSLQNIKDEIKRLDDIPDLSEECILALISVNETLIPDDKRLATTDFSIEMIIGECENTNDIKMCLDITLKIISSQLAVRADGLSQEEGKMPVFVLAQRRYEYSLYILVEAKKAVELLQLELEKSRRSDRSGERGFLSLFQLRALAITCSKRSPDVIHQLPFEDLKLLVRSLLDGSEYSIAQDPNTYENRLLMQKFGKYCDSESYVLPSILSKIDAMCRALDQCRKLSESDENLNEFIQLLNNVKQRFIEYKTLAFSDMDEASALVLQIIEQFFDELAKPTEFQVKNVQKILILLKQKFVNYEVLSNLQRKLQAEQDQIVTSVTDLRLLVDEFTYDELTSIKIICDIAQERILTTSDTLEEAQRKALEEYSSASEVLQYLIEIQEDREKKRGESYLPSLDQVHQFVAVIKKIRDSNGTYRNVFDLTMFDDGRDGDESVNVRRGEIADILHEICKRDKEALLEILNEYIAHVEKNIEEKNWPPFTSADMGDIQQQKMIDIIGFLRSKPVAGLKELFVNGMLQLRLKIKKGQIILDRCITREFELFINTMLKRISEFDSKQSDTKPTMRVTLQSDRPCIMLKEVLSMGGAYEVERLEALLHLLEDTSQKIIGDGASLDELYLGREQEEAQKRLCGTLEILRYIIAYQNSKLARHGAADGQAPIEDEQEKIKLFVTVISVARDIPPNADYDSQLKWFAKALVGNESLTDEKLKLLYEGNVEDNLSKLLSNIVVALKKGSIHGNTRTEPVVLVTGSGVIMQKDGDGNALTVKQCSQHKTSRKNVMLRFFGMVLVCVIWASLIAICDAYEIELPRTLFLGLLGISIFVTLSCIIYSFFQNREQKIEKRDGKELSEDKFSGLAVVLVLCIVLGVSCAITSILISAGLLRDMIPSNFQVDPGIYLLIGVFLLAICVTALSCLLENSQGKVVLMVNVSDSGVSQVTIKSQNTRGSDAATDVDALVHDKTSKRSNDESTYVGSNVKNSTISDSGTGDKAKGKENAPTESKAPADSMKEGPRALENNSVSNSQVGVAKDAVFVSGIAETQAEVHANPTVKDSAFSDSGTSDNARGKENAPKDSQDLADPLTAGLGHNLASHSQVGETNNEVDSCSVDEVDSLLPVPGGAMNSVKVRSNCFSQEQSK